MKHFKKLLVFIFIIPCMFLFSACSILQPSKVCITKIEKTSETEYTIYYSNGTTEIIEIEANTNISVVDIKKTATAGTLSIYTIYYSDGTTSSIEINDTPPSEGVYVTNIEKTGTENNITTYTVHYSNGTTSMFTVENGKNGADGDDFTLELLKEYSIEKGYDDFDTFLKEYLSVDYKEKSVASATNIAIQSAVSIWCEFPVSTFYEKDVDIACGAGVIYKMNDEYSYVITNYHVVYYTKTDKDDKIANKVHLFQYGTNETAYITEDLDQNGYPKIVYGDGAIEATYVGGSLKHDLAILKVKTEDLKTYNPNVKAVTVAEEYELAETAIAIGNPECDGISVTQGVVSVLSETIKMKGADNNTDCAFRVMRIDTAVNGGNSGGGLFNIDGELIGIVNAKVIDTEIDNIAYALPFDNVTKVVDKIIYNYEQDPTKPAQLTKFVLDIAYTAENSRAVYNPTTNKTTLKEDLVIHTVNIASADNTHVGAGYTMGMKAGDIIKAITINDVEHEIIRTHMLGDLLLTIKEGDKVMFTIVRDNLTTTCGFTDDEGVTSTYFDIIL